jgi:tetratricopeptide (TPR) repeat protein
MAQAGEELFRSEDLLVRFVRAGGAPSAACFVTFASYTNEYTLDRQGFAEDFLHGEGIDAVHVLNRDNRWYQYPEMDEALAAAAKVARAYPRVFSYGSSMGGYAALRFARALGAETAIAISPQYSLDPRVVPFEERWQADLAAITFREVPVEPAARQVIFYDPRMRLDDQHFRRFAALPTETVGVAVPYAGHPVGPILIETGVLKDSVRAIVAGRFDAGRVQRAVRERRRRSQHHFFMLARRAEHRRPGLQIALLRRAAEIRPESHILGELAAALDRRGDHAEAGPLHVEALRLVPGNARARIGYARHLEATGRAAEAAAELRRAADGQGGSVRLLVRTVQVRMALRRWGLGKLDAALGRQLFAVRQSPRYATVTRWMGKAMR